MSEITNIIFDNSLLESDKHKKNLIIASLNLAEFNKRNPENENIRFQYLKVKDNYLFKIVKGSIYPHYSERYLPLDWFIAISGEPQMHSDWVHNYPKKMFSNFEYYKGLSNDHKEIIKEIDLFISLFKDYVPLGNFLSEDHQIEIKNKFNEFCSIVESYR